MIKKIAIYVFLLGSLSLFSSTTLTAQLGVYLQLEVINSPKTIKYAAGDHIQFKTEEYPDEWQKERIKEILVEEEVLVCSYPQC